MILELSCMVLGIILGVILAALCIICCITFILLRRRCLKRRAVARARLAMSSNYHPAVAHYTSQLGTVQVRLVKWLLHSKFYSRTCLITQCFLEWKSLVRWMSMKLNIWYRRNRVRTYLLLHQSTLIQR